jgi:hypothetical protein
MNCIPIACIAPSLRQKEARRRIRGRGGSARARIMPIYHDLPPRRSRPGCGQKRARRRGRVAVCFGRGNTAPSRPYGSAWGRGGSARARIMPTHHDLPPRRSRPGWHGQDHTHSPRSPIPPLSPWPGHKEGRDGAGGSVRARIMPAAIAAIHHDLPSHRSRPGPAIKRGETARAGGRLFRQGNTAPSRPYGSWV